MRAKIVSDKQLEYVGELNHFTHYKNFNDHLTESWLDDELSLFKEPEKISELLNTDTLYHATYKPYWEEI